MHMQWSGCTDPTQTTASLVIDLVSRRQKSRTGGSNLVKWKGAFTVPLTEIT